MIVQDWKEREIKVGTKGQYGAPAEGESLENYLCEVVEISEPDMRFADDEYGREVPIDCYVEITLKFSDGETTKIPASLRGARWYDEDEVYEESGDFEVVEEEVTENA